MNKKESALFKLNIVSIEKEIFSGNVYKLIITGSLGEFEVFRNHAPLLTALYPGQVLYVDENGKNHNIVIFGGMVEVQPMLTTVLADSYVRKEDINEEEVLKVKNILEKDLSRNMSSYEYARVRAELIQATVQLKFLRTQKKII